MKVIRLGIVGTGISARHLHMPALKRLRDRIRVVSVYNHHCAKAERFAADFRVPRVAPTLSALLRDPEVDVVLLTLPIHLNPVIGRQVLRAGKPCLCEKPLAHTLAAGTAFVRDAARYRKPFLVTENYVFHPMWRKFIETVGSGAIGRPRFFEMRILHKMDVRNPYARTRWRIHPRHLGGFLGDAGVHFAAIMRRMFGEPRKVTSRVLSLRPEVPPVDTLFSLMEFKGGLTGHVAYSFSIQSDHGLVWNVYGDRGVLRLTDGRMVLQRGKGLKVLVYGKMDSFEAMYRHYHSVLTGHQGSSYKLQDAYRDLRLIHRMIAGR